MGRAPVGLPVSRAIEFEDAPGGGRVSRPGRWCSTVVRLSSHQARPPRIREHDGTQIQRRLYESTETGRQGTIDSMRRMFPVGTELMAWFMFAMTGTSAVSILLGFFAQVAGACMVALNLMGVRFHLGSAKQAQEIGSQHPDSAEMAQIAAIPGVGHRTSAQKNVVLAAVGLLFLLLGTGPFSLTEPIVWGWR